jgi:uncharacterized membrane protein YedE/YeeE
MKLGTALLAGLLFGLGLSLAGMTDPAVVLGFLDVAGAWNPRLLFVMAGAVITTAIGYRWVWRGSRPWFGDAFHVPGASRIDHRLVFGALLFGLGWGIAGYCPGPALASLSIGQAAVFVLVGTMVLGWWLGSRVPAPTR